MVENLRVHIIPIGFDSARATHPLIETKADRVYLIKHETDKRRGHTEYYDWIIKKLEKEQKSIEIIQVTSDLWNLDELVEKIRQIIQNEKKKGNHLYVNVSTGPKVAGIAGMMACMICEANPYYVHLDYSKDKGAKMVKSLPVQKITELPVYQIQKPTPNQLLILEILIDSDRMGKSELISKLEDKGIIASASLDKAQFRPQAKHGQLRSILDPMERDWGFVIIDRHGKHSDVQITEKGRQAFRIFGADGLI